MNRAIFLDRDGTLITDEGYLNDWRKVKFYRSAISALKIFQRRGFRLIIVTNQSGVARGLVKKKQLFLIHQYIRRFLRKKGIKISAIYFCPHLPDEKCLCRKPNRFLYEKARKRFQLDFRQSYVIGDKVSDIQAGKNIGAKTILVLTGLGRREKKILKKENVRPDFIAANLLSAVKYIR